MIEGCSDVTTRHNSWVELSSMGRYDGADATQSVWVTVDERGRLASLEISRTWRTRMSADKVPDAVYESYAAAMRRRVTELADQLDVRAPARRERTRPPLGDVATEAHAAIEEARAVLRAERDSDRKAGEVTEFRGPNGYLALRVRDGVVVGLTGDPAALANANPGLLRDDAFEAFRSANLVTQN